MRTAHKPQEYPCSLAQCGLDFDVFWHPSGTTIGQLSSHKPAGATWATHSLGVCVALQAENRLWIVMFSICQCLRTQVVYELRLTTRLRGNNLECSPHQAKWQEAFRTLTAGQQTDLLSRCPTSASGQSSRTGLCGQWCGLWMSLSCASLAHGSQLGSDLSSVPGLMNKGTVCTWP